jgi:hypothetical protein
MFKKSVMDYVEEVLGTFAKGLFIDNSLINKDNPIYSNIYSNLEDEEIVDVDRTDTFYVTGGYTKLVIIPKYENYVIKIPYTGSYDINADTDEIYLEREFDIDICDEENAIYDNSSEELQQFMAYNTFAGLYNGCIRVYTQPKINITSSEAEDNFKSITSAREKIIMRFEYTYNFYYDWNIINYFIETFGINKAKEILRELDCIDDLHSNNLGYTNSGHLYLIDFGGYESSYFTSNCA